MKISTIQIKDYRSISEAKLSLGEITILLGKNNEGKSNLLMAVNIAISTLQEFAEIKKRRLFYSRFRTFERYSWERDYPIAKQKGDKRNKKSTFILEFTLDTHEVEEFKKNIGHQLNGNLQIKITFGNENRPDIKVVKQGKGSKPLNEKSQKVARYIAEHIEFNYIPAVRTVDHTMDIINEQISERLQGERKNKDYQDALDKINEIEKNVLSNLSGEIKNTLTEFLPETKNVKLTSDDIGIMIRHRQDINVLIDDGEETNLLSKGDGVKSLVAMSLLKSKKLIANSVSVIAIEEPESHLHPSAIDALRKAIHSLSGHSQVIITTHNPQFVNRNDIGSNIIVDDGNAKKAENIREVREILGVKLSDNLFNARLLLYVEGVTDRMVLMSLLSHYSTKLRDAIAGNELVIQPMSGTHHIEMHLASAKTMLADYHLFLDGDIAGCNSVSRACGLGLLDPRDYTLTHYSDMPLDSEMEDMLDLNVYRDVILDKYGVDISLDGTFRARNRKWSSRIETVFINAGKIFDDNTLNDLKFLVASRAADNPAIAMRPEGLVMLQGLISTLEGKL